MKIPHPIPYQGSKRNLAEKILQFFPRNIDVLIEPFSGSAAVSLIAAAHKKAKKYHLNDVNKPLIALWNDIINNSEDTAKKYMKLWYEQIGNERSFYDEIRDKFNETQRTDYFLYLLARCVKASIRYNSNGEFNQSPDNRRKGRHPGKMREDIFGASFLLKGKTKLSDKDYKEVIMLATEKDLIYMDPPYQGVCTNRDPRYINIISFKEIVSELSKLVKRDMSFILSYDGRLGEKTYGQPLPSTLNLFHLEIEAGRSSQSTLLGRNHVTYESLYLSPALVEQLDLSSIGIYKSTPDYQLNLFA